VALYVCLKMMGKLFDKFRTY